MSDPIFCIAPTHLPDLTALIDRRIRSHTRESDLIRLAGVTRSTQTYYPLLASACVAIASGRKPHQELHAPEIRAAAAVGDDMHNRTRRWWGSFQASFTAALFNGSMPEDPTCLLVEGDIYRYLCPSEFYRTLPDYDEMAEVLRAYAINTPDAKPTPIWYPARTFGTHLSPIITFALFNNTPMTVAAPAQIVDAAEKWLESFRAMNPEAEITPPTLLRREARP